MSLTPCYVYTVFTYYYDVYFVYFDLCQLEKYLDCSILWSMTYKLPKIPLHAFCGVYFIVLTVYHIGYGLC